MASGENIWGSKVDVVSLDAPDVQSVSNTMWTILNASKPS